MEGWRGSWGWGWGWEGQSVGWRVDERVGGEIEEVNGKYGK